MIVLLWIGLGLLFGALCLCGLAAFAAGMSDAGDASREVNAWSLGALACLIGIVAAIVLIARYYLN